jgi:hypothetical protein
MIYPSAVLAQPCDENVGLPGKSVGFGTTLTNKPQHEFPSPTRVAFSLSEDLQVSPEIFARFGIGSRVDVGVRVCYLCISGDVVVLVLGDASTSASVFLSTRLEASGATGLSSNPNQIVPVLVTRFTPYLLYRFSPSGRTTVGLLARFDHPFGFGSDLFRLGALSNITWESDSHAGFSLELAVGRDMVPSFEGPPGFVVAAITCAVFHKF